MAFVSGPLQVGDVSVRDADLVDLAHFTLTATVFTITNSLPISAVYMKVSAAAA